MGSDRWLSIARKEDDLVTHPWILRTKKLVLRWRADVRPFLQQGCLVVIQKVNGAKRTRTADPLHAMQVLYQLSYGPIGLTPMPESPAVLPRKAYTAG